MKKEHSAVDWSTRPLPEPWLEYAALDVEVLVELRDVLEAELIGAGQGRVGAAGVRGPPRLRGAGAGRGLAAYVGAAQGPRPPGPGRRTRPLGDPRRDRPAARRHARPDRAGRRARRGGHGAARRQGRAARHEGLPRPRRRALREALDRRDPRRPGAARGRPAHPHPARRRAAGAAGLGRARRGGGPPAQLAREAMAALAEEHHLPVENLLTPDTCAGCCGRRPRPGEPGELVEAVVDQLTAYGARGWQIALVAPLIVRSILDADSYYGAATPSPRATGVRRLRLVVGVEQHGRESSSICVVSSVEVEHRGPEHLPRLPSTARSSAGSRRSAAAAPCR